MATRATIQCATFFNPSGSHRFNIVPCLFSTSGIQICVKRYVLSTSQSFSSALIDFIRTIDQEEQRNSIPLGNAQLSLFDFRLEGGFALSISAFNVRRLRCIDRSHPFVVLPPLTLDRVTAPWPCRSPPAPATNHFDHCTIVDLTPEQPNVSTLRRVSCVLSVTFNQSRVRCWQAL